MTAVVGKRDRRAAAGPRRRGRVLAAAAGAALVLLAAPSHVMSDGAFDAFVSGRFPLFGERSDKAAAPQPRARPGEAATRASEAPPARAARAAAPRGDLSPHQRALLSAYPGAFTFEGNAVVFASGERIIWDDGRRKTPRQLLAEPDVEDMFAYPYPAGTRPAAPPRDHDPGRVRNEAFFKALYGSSADEVRRSVRQIPWVPTLGDAQVTVTTRFGIDRRLAAVSAELERLPPRFHPFLTPPGGGFVWRAIAGTDRLSVHSYGAAIDIGTLTSNYWRWDGAPAGGPIAYRNRVPVEIVRIFEAHCFIWGGRWYHYDTMHFEYRPELLPACRR